MLIRADELVAEMLPVLEAQGIDRDRVRAALRHGEMRRDDLRMQLACLIDARCAEYSPTSRTRLCDLLLDALESEALYPAYSISEEAITLQTAPVYALLYNAKPHIANELYPLMVDGYVAAMQGKGAPHFQVFGIHADWLHGSTFRRAILFDEVTQGVLECNVANQPSITAAHLLALDLRCESESHRSIEARLAEKVRVMNPWHGAARLDDKQETGNCWMRAGLPTPSFLSLAPSDSLMQWQAATADFIGEHGTRLVMKPTRGTEGRGVRRLDGSASDACSCLLGEMHAAGDACLLMQERGLLRCFVQLEPLRFALRLNVCWDGAQAHVESGYALLAADRDGLATAGQGGRIITLADCWQQLCLEDGARVTPTLADWHCLLHTAEEGTIALAGVLGDTLPALIGLDILLDMREDGAIQPVLLEANGRPAGMGHCRMLHADGPGEVPGVSQFLFTRVIHDNSSTHSHTTAIGDSHAY